MNLRRPLITIHEQVLAGFTASRKKTVPGDDIIE